MKARVLTGIFGGGALLAYLLFLPPIFTVSLMTPVCVLAMYEILAVTNIVSHRGLTAAAMLFAAVVPFFRVETGLWFPAAALFVYTAVLGCIQVKYHATLKAEQTGFVFFVSTVIPLSLSCLGYLRLQGEHGLFYVLLALIMPWFADIGAYFVGTLCGKHKLCPNISPKKTVEGLIGGVVVSVGVTLLAAWVYVRFFAHEAVVCWWQLAVLSLVCAPLSVLGDLFASIIKRQSGAKDYGHLIPGHGGVMDRFDSLIFTAPVLYLVVLACPFIR